MWTCALSSAWGLTAVECVCTACTFREYVLSLGSSRGYVLVLLSACCLDGSSLEGPEAWRQWIAIPPSHKRHLPFP